MIKKITSVILSFIICLSSSLSSNKYKSLVIESSSNDDFHLINTEILQNIESSSVFFLRINADSDPSEQLNEIAKFEQIIFLTNIENYHIPESLHSWFNKIHSPQLKSSAINVFSKAQVKFIVIADKKTYDSSLIYNKRNKLKINESQLINLLIEPSLRCIYEISKSKAQVMSFYLKSNLNIKTLTSSAYWDINTAQINKFISKTK